MEEGLSYNVYVQLHVYLKYEKIPSIDTVLSLLYFSKLICDSFFSFGVNLKVV